MRSVGPVAGKHRAQETADRIQLLREELALPELRDVLRLTPEQQDRFDSWSNRQLQELAGDFDIDINASQKQVSWGMRIASTLGAIAICTAIVLFFLRYWGYMNTPLQVVIVFQLPLLTLAGAEFAFSREKTLYFTGLLALLSLASFVMNLSVLGSIFDIVSTERALLAWGAFAVVLAYRYGLRLLQAIGILFLICYVAAMTTAQLGYRWLDFGDRPELIALLALLTFGVPFAVEHKRQPGFPAVYRLVGSIVFFVCILSLAEWGGSSYLAFSQKSIERFYEFVGLLISAGGIWLGIRQNWTGVVGVSATMFVIFLYTRLYHWWWDWMPKYLFFAVIGGLGIALVVVFKRIRGRMMPGGSFA